MKYYLQLFLAYFPRIGPLWWGIVLGVWAMVFLWLRFRRSDEAEVGRMKRALSGSVAFCYGFLLLIMLVLARSERESQAYILQPFHTYKKILTGTAGSAEWGCLAIFNFLLYMPLGFFFAAARRMRRAQREPVKALALHSGALGFAVSLLIEILQLVLRRGVFELDDLFHNTLGAMAGALLWRIADKIHAHTGRSAQ